MEFKWQYWAIAGALIIVALALTVPLLILNADGEEENPHTPEELAQMMQESTIEYDNQIAAYEDLLAANPNDDVALSGLAGIYLTREGEYNKAVDLFSRAIAVNPTNPFYYEGLGSAYFELQLYDKSEEQLQTAMEMAPDSQEIMINMGIILSQTGRAEEATQLWQRAYDLDPTNDYGHMAEQLLGKDTGGGTDSAVDNPHQ